MLELVDTHCHLNDDQFRNDLDEVIKRAKDNNIEVIIMGYDESSSYEAVRIANSYPNCYAAIGLQPQEKKPDNLDFILRLVQDKKVVCIGEIGLDLYWPDNDPLDLQVKFFRKQLEIAIKYSLPVSIHARNAINEVLSVVNEFKGQVKGVLHCFTEDIIMANKIIEAGLYLGIGGVITYKKTDLFKAAIKEVPLSCIVLETDAPYLPPQKYRNLRRNEPSFITEVAKEIASIKEITLEEVVKATTKNAKELFKI